MDDVLDYKPRWPEKYKPGIGIVGCGTIVRNAHLPAYRKYGLNVVGVYDISQQAMAEMKDRFDVRTFQNLDELIHHKEIEIIDIAVHPEHRPSIVTAAIEAGKHILCQKPLATDMDTAKKMIALARQNGITLAVNLNARWAPAFRIASRLIQKGRIGNILAISHMYDRKFDWIPGTVYDNLPHFAIYDYSTHWIDITRCWAETLTINRVRARDYRTPNQPAKSKTPWGMWIEFEYEGGANALIRGIGGSETSRKAHPFAIHGTEGTIRGSVLGQDYIELEHKEQFTSFELEGEWFPDGFGGTMGELLCSIEQEYEPYNSAAHNLLSLEMTLAACRSADLGGQGVTIGIQESTARDL